MVTIASVHIWFAVRMCQFSTSRGRSVSTKTGRGKVQAYCFNPSIKISSASVDTSQLICFDFHNFICRSVGTVRCVEQIVGKQCTSWGPFLAQLHLMGLASFGLHFSQVIEYPVYTLSYRVMLFERDEQIFKFSVDHASFNKCYKLLTRAIRCLGPDDHAKMLVR